jgi:hypothetical protein
MRVELHERIGDDPEAELAAVQDRDRALDVAGLLQAPHATQAGRGREVHARGQLLVRERGIRLQLLQDAQVRVVELGRGGHAQFPRRDRRNHIASGMEFTQSDCAGCVRLSAFAAGLRGAGRGSG